MILYILTINYIGISRATRVRHIITFQVNITLYHTCPNSRLHCDAVIKVPMSESD